MKKYKSIFYLTAAPTQNAGSLKQYFIKRAESFVAFHFFPGFSTAATFFELYENGNLQQTKKSILYSGKNKLLKNLSDFLFFSYALLFFTKRKSYVIVNAPFYCFFSGIFSFIKSFTYVFWIGDYYPDKSFPMNIYHAVVNYYNRVLPIVIYLSPPLQKIYANRNNAKNKIRKQVSLGIKKEFLRKKSESLKNDPLQVGFVGIIRQQQGLDLFFKFLQKYEGFMLHVVGDGYLLPYYKKLAKDLNINKCVTFHGRVDDISSVFKKCDIGIALYENIESNLSLYCEPTKIKHYLSYGLPVITTNTTYFGKELEKYNAGVVVSEDVVSLYKGIEKIRANYKKYSEGVSAITDAYEYEHWYDKRLTFLR